MFTECTSDSHCNGTSDRCGADGTCMCGNADACYGVSDTCNESTCKCGTNDACSGNSDTCDNSTCKCGSNDACSGDTPYCASDSSGNCLGIHTPII